MNSDNAITNSIRKIEKRSYTPLILPVDDKSAGDALSLAALVRMLEIHTDELGQLSSRVTGTDAKAAVATIGSMLNGVSGSQVLLAASQLASMKLAAIQEVGQSLAALRSDIFASLKPELEALQSRYSIASKAVLGAPTNDPTKAIRSKDKATQIEGPSPSAITQHTRSAIKEGSATKGAATALPHPAKSPVGAQSFLSLRTGLPPTNIAISRMANESSNVVTPLLTHVMGGLASSSLGAALSWSVMHEPAMYYGLVDKVSGFVPSRTGSPADLAGALSEINRLALLPQLFLDALTRRPLQPVGLLHLERLEMTPLEVEQGDLLYSLPLAPAEKVTLAHKEWTVTEQEYTDFIEDYLENFSEKGVSESNDMAMSTTTQTQHSNALSMSQSPTVTNAVTMTPPVSSTTSGSTVDDAASKDESRSVSRQSTSLASARAIQDHKVSFTVTTVSGIQDFTARVLVNNSPDHSMRVDYFQRMRKWRNQLYRYGVRMTYDVVLPDPGAKVRARVRELQDIDLILATSFSFDLVASDIQPWNWTSLADQYGAVLPAPPEQSQTIETEKTVSYPEPQPDPITNVIDPLHEETLTIQIPDGFTVSGLQAEVNIDCWDASSSWMNIFAGEQIAAYNADATGWINGSDDFTGAGLPLSGTLTFLFLGKYLRTGRFLITAEYIPTDGTMAAWQQRCWAILHDAAYTDFIQQRSQMRDRRTTLQQQIAGDDALTLRRREREEIMRLVLSWLFPGFQDASSVLNMLPDPGNLDFATWQQIMEYGEYIKFVQSAIDWDNVMVFLYPYFWDTRLNETEKLLLTHPDPLHREFLRAGAARVVLAIQPGFEEQVVALLDLGNLGSLPQNTRFQKVITDVKAANAAYARTTQNNQNHDDPAVPGVLIGTWTDYTPTSALDIDVTMRAVTVQNAGA